MICSLVPRKKGFLSYGVRIVRWKRYVTISMVVTLLSSHSIELQDMVTLAHDSSASDALAPVQLVVQKRSGIGRFRSTQQMS